MAQASTMELLDELMGKTATKIATLDATLDVDDELIRQQENMRKEAEQEVKQAVQRRRRPVDIQKTVLESTIEQIHANDAREEEDTADAVFGVNTLMKKLDAELSDQLNQRTPAQEQRLQSARDAVAEAEQELARAKTKWWWREEAITAATTKIDNRQRQLSETEREVESEVRQELKKATLQQSLDRLNFLCDKAKTMLHNRIGALKTGLDKIILAKRATFEEKKKAGDAYESLKLQIDEFTQDLAGAEEILTGYENGSPEYINQENEVSTLRGKLDALRGSQNAAFIALQATTKFIKILEVHEQTHRTQSDTHTGWLVMLTVEMPKRVTAFEARLNEMKAASDAEIAKHLDAVASEADQRGTENAAAMGHTAYKMLMDVLERYPERIVDISKVQEAQAAGLRTIKGRMDRLAKQWEERYGINPLDASPVGVHDDQGEGDAQEP